MNNSMLVLLNLYEIYKFNIYSQLDEEKGEFIKF